MGLKIAQSTVISNEDRVPKDQVVASVTPVTFVPGEGWCKVPTEPRTRMVWGNFQLIKEVQKSRDVRIRVSAAVKDSVKYIFIQEWQWRVMAQEWRPTTRHVTIPVMYPLMDKDSKKCVDMLEPIEELVQAILDAKDVALEMKPFDEETAVFVDLDKQKGNKNETSYKRSDFRKQV